jgi:Ca2+-binding EF-hand superfamily protein
VLPAAKSDEDDTLMQKVFFEADVDENGYIDYEEFKRCLQNMGYEHCANTVLTLY